MASSGQETTALLTEHLRYTPLTLLDDIINTANELVFRAVNAIEEGLGAATAENLGFKLDKATASSLRSDQARQDALQELKQNEIDNGIVKLESLLNATVDKDFDKFEIYTLRNILAVGHEEEDLASWVRLDHYKNIQVADASKGPTPEEIQARRRKLHETAKLNSLLKVEAAKNAAILSQLTSLISGGEGPQPQDAASFSFMNPATRPPGDQKLTQSSQYALNQLPALQQLLGQLKEAVESEPGARQSRFDDEDTTEGKRRRYIDSRSRRALERRGIDPESSSSTVLANSRKLARNELEGIEAVARTIGSSGQEVVPADEEMAD